MLKTIEIISAKGIENNVAKLLKKQVIDFLKTNDDTELSLQYQSEWQSVPSSSPAGVVDKISWECNTWANQNNVGGSCNIYFESDEQIRSKTSEKIVKDGEAYSVEIRVTS